MEINIFFEQIDAFYFQDDLKTWIDKTIKDEKLKTGVLNIIFCSDDYLLKMNQEHLQHDYYTDIITFDYCTNEIVSGDLFISKDRVEENAQKFDINFNEEINRVVIHGVLHLIGYNDKTEEQKKQMTEKENLYLAKFNV